MPNLHAKSARSDTGLNVELSLAEVTQSTLRDARTSLFEAERAVCDLSSGSRVTVSADSAVGTNTAAIAWLLRIANLCAERSIELSLAGFSDGAKRLLELARSVPERTSAGGGSGRTRRADSTLEVIGKGAFSIFEVFKDWCSFTGELLVESWSFLRGRARVPIRDIWETIDQCGPSALPIVTLISTLVGVILAFIGAQQLRQFGAEIYVANLVGVGMLREMGAVMAAVIMAGRTGAAFAAQLGTMQVNEEIDALQTFGFSPMQYLVIPRVLALVLMMPLLCLYADGLGIIGGALVSSLTLDISLWRYYQQTVSAISLSDLWLGVSKSVVFGVLVALSGCLAGIRCGRSASAVGTAVTTAVVSGIISIVISDAIFAVITEMVGL
jgi:phospholipid/cholesterol/gamma-HCH transport system permease protein